MHRILKVGVALLLLSGGTAHAVDRSPAASTAVLKNHHDAVRLNTTACMPAGRRGVVAPVAIKPGGFAPTPQTAA